MEVAWRTIAADINAMRYDEGLKYYAPIKNERGIGYYYEDPNYSIDEIPLNEEELHALSFTAKLLRQFSDVDIFESFNEAVGKLSDRLEIGLKSQLEGAKYNFIEFETGVVQSGSEYLAPIIEAIKSEICVSIEYSSFQKKQASKYELHPYYLKEYRNRWYVIGWCKEADEIRTFGLDRIQKLEHRFEIDYHYSEFNPKEYYKHALGISVLRDQDPANIKLRISPKQAPYVLSRPIHDSQELIKTTDDYIEIKLHVIINYELISTLLGMGSDLKVLEPESLKAQITEAHKGASGG